MALIAFVALFALVLIRAERRLEIFRRTAQEAGGKMRQTAAGETVVTVTNLLRSWSRSARPGLRGVLARFQMHPPCARPTRTAGRNELESHAPAFGDGFGDHPGFGIGAVAPSLLNGPLRRLCWHRHLHRRRIFTSSANGNSGWTNWKSSFRNRWISWRAPCARGTRSRSAWRCWARRYPIRWVRNTALCLMSRTWGLWLDIALRNFSERVPLLDVRFFTSSVLLQKQTGGNLSEILGRLAYVIRERFRLKGAVKAASAHGRMTATILTLLPVGTMGCLLVVATGYLQGMAAERKPGSS